MRLKWLSNCKCTYIYGSKIIEWLLQLERRKEGRTRHDQAQKCPDDSFEQNDLYGSSNLEKI